VLAECYPYQSALLTRLEVLSLAFDPEWSHLLPGNLLQVTGMIVNKGWLSRSTITNWLTYDGLEAEWNQCIGRRDKDPQVAEFLARSALPDDFFAMRAGGSAVPNLRLDRLGPSAPSKKPGRAPKRPQPDAGFNNAGGARMSAPARARPAPADSTLPDAAAAAGAEAALGPPPSPAAPAADPAARASAALDGRGRGPLLPSTGAGLGYPRRARARASAPSTGAGAGFGRPRRPPGLGPRPPGRGGRSCDSWPPLGAGAGQMWGGKGWGGGTTLA
jgi:hypothetical protein